MQWSPEAEKAVSKAPFFVRKRVRKRVEEEASRCNSAMVTLDHVETCRKRFLTRMEDEVKGFQVEGCFGQSGCPNRAVISDGLDHKLEERLSARELNGFLKKRVQGPLKLHHEFRISFSDCPNACSRPQIVDMGLIGASRPERSNEPCSECGACVEACREGAVTIENGLPRVHETRCLSCGQCARVCPTGSLREGGTGYRVLVGGKLGRHPRLGTELPEIYTEEEALRVVEACLDYYQENCHKGERLGEILERTGVEVLKGSLKKAQEKNPNP